MVIILGCRTVKYLYLQQGETDSDKRGVSNYKSFSDDLTHRILQGFGGEMQDTGDIQEHYEAILA
jgi:hypothetical protein